MTIKDILYAITGKQERCRRKTAIAAVTALMLAGVFIIIFGCQDHVYAAERTAANNAATYYSIFGNKISFCSGCTNRRKSVFLFSGEKG